MKIGIVVTVFEVVAAAVVIGIVEFVDGLVQLNFICRVRMSRTTFGLHAAHISEASKRIASKYQAELAQCFTYEHNFLRSSHDVPRTVHRRAAQPT